jgi:proteasome lid subunit RPN8/RPN11
MANEKYDSDHVVIPVRSASGEIHNIAVPGDTPIPDFHEALVNAGYHNDLTQQAQPTAEGAIENSPEFKKAAEQAWQGAGNGARDQEAGALIQKNGRTLQVPTSNRDSKLNLPVNMNTFGTIHTHPNSKDTMPSPEDIQAAKTNNMPFYVVSKGGLMMVDVDGQVYQTYKSAADVFDKNKKSPVPVKK